MNELYRETEHRLYEWRRPFKRAGLIPGIAISILGMSLLTFTTTSQANGRISLTDLNAQLTALEQRAEALRQAGGIPAGTIIMWSGDFDDIPAGWALCDGNNGTPDLRSRFVLGGSLENPIPEAGGHWNHRHADDHRHVYPHDHGLSGVTTNAAGAHTHEVDTPTGPAGSTALVVPLVIDYKQHKHNLTSAGQHSHQLTKNGQQARTEQQRPQDLWTAPSETQLDAQGHLPPYHSLAFIMKLPAD